MLRQKCKRDYKSVGFSPRIARTQHSTGGLRTTLAGEQKLREAIDVATVLETPLGHLIPGYKSVAAAQRSDSTFDVRCCA